MASVNRSMSMVECLCSPLIGVITDPAPLNRLLASDHGICPHVARATCFKWLNESIEIWPESNASLPEYFVCLKPLGFGRRLRYVMRPTGTRTGLAMKPFDDGEPLSVTNGPGPLHLVLRQDVTLPIEVEARERALTQSPQWKRAKSNLKRTISTYASEDGPLENLELIPPANLRMEGLPDTKETAAALTAESQEDPSRSESLTVRFRVTSMLFYDEQAADSAHTPGDIIQYTTDLPLNMDDRAHRAVIVVKGQHVKFIESKFPAIRRFSGQYASRGAIGTSYFEEMFNEFGGFHSDSDWNRFHRAVRLESERDGLDPGKSWKAAKEFLRRKGITLKSIKQKAR